jgi:hypothetical protein
MVVFKTEPNKTEVRLMKTGIIATSFLMAALALPMAAQARSDCGVPQGYGTTNPFTFNRSTCGFGDNSYHVPAGATLDREVSETVTKPADIGTNNAFLPNTGAPQTGSNTGGLSTYSYTTPSTYVDNATASEPLKKPAGYGTNNPFIPNSGALHLGSNTDGM